MRPHAMGAIYFLLAIAGAALPYTQLTPWVARHGIAPVPFLAELFSTRIGAFFGMDVIVSAIVLFVFVAREGRGVPLRWMPIITTLLVGVSCGLPLFLGLREWRER